MDKCANTSKYTTAFQWRTTIPCWKAELLLLWCFVWIACFCVRAMSALLNPQSYAFAASNFHANLELVGYDHVCGTFAHVLVGSKPRTPDPWPNCRLLAKPDKSNDWVLPYMQASMMSASKLTASIVDDNLTNSVNFLLPGYAALAAALHLPPFLQVQRKERQPRQSFTNQS